MKKKAPTPNNAVGIAKYSKSSIGSPHILSITITSISNIGGSYPLNPLLMTGKQQEKE